MYDENMKRLQILIEEDLDEALERQARTEGTSKAALIRRFVRDRIEPQPALEDDPIWELVGFIDGGSRDDSLNVDDIVYPRE